MTYTGRYEREIRVLLNARTLIQQKGWITGRLRTEQGYCLIGAIDYALSQERGDGPLRDVGDVSYPTLAAALGFHDVFGSIGGPGIAAWNDETGRTKEQVIERINEAVQRLIVEYLVPEEQRERWTDPDSPIAFLHQVVEEAKAKNNQELSHEEKEELVLI